MKILPYFKDYSLIATGNGMKLERFQSVVLLRPDPQITWDTPFDLYSYKDLNAYYIKKSGQRGEWRIKNHINDNFILNWQNLKFSLSLKSFKHTGIFPEQAINWQKIIDLIKNSKREIRVLNLFAYTGGATMAAISGGGRVCHVDALKSACNTAKKNISLSGLDPTKARFIVDDCVKFTQREIKRGKKYDAIIMDPPSFGLGPKKEIWKIEDNLYKLIELTKKVLSDKALFYLINTYSQSLDNKSVKTLVNSVFDDNIKAQSYELGIKGEDNRILPCGNSVLLEF